MKVISEFTVKDWKQEDLSGDRSGLPIMRVSAVYECNDTIKGKFLVENVMHYQRKNQGDETRYAGIMVFEGSINDKHGTFALKDCGVYKRGEPTCMMELISYSGTGDFANVGGSGKYYMKNQKMIMELEMGVIEDLVCGNALNTPNG